MGSSAYEPCGGGVRQRHYIYDLLRGQLSANQSTEVSRLREELEAAGRNNTQLESEKDLDLLNGVTC